MLKFVLTDIHHVETILIKPLSVSIVSSEDAPADSFHAVFAVSGRIPELYSVRVLKGSEILFFGYIDQQTETTAESGILLEIRARSMAAVLLDNEALPQTYCMPSMRLLFERHFKPLGMTGYEGTDKAFAGELVISKGMSEWQVLSGFCEKFYHSVPRVRNDGVIETGESNSNDTVYLGTDHAKIRISRTIKRSVLISDIYARTCKAGGYEMYFGNECAQKHGVYRRRYVNTIDSKHRSALYSEDIIKSTNQKYESYTVDVSGIVLCRVGDTLRIDNIAANMKIKELHYVMNGKGESTRIYAEVTD